jgi:conjugative transfer signal peptidase TraF
MLCDVVGVRFNLSASLPIGLYITTQKTSKLVEFCPPEPFARMAAERGYRSAGACPDGATPLLKPVVARAGDTVQVSAQGITVNGHLVLNTVPLKRDIKRRRLTAWPSGTYTVQPGMIWVVSSYSSRSFDSRYFGLIAANSVREWLKPVGIWP